MKLSRYVYTVKNRSDDYLMVCIATNALIRLNERAKQELINGNPATLVELTQVQFAEAINMGFLVEDNLDESAFLGYVLHKDRLCPSSLTTYVAFSTNCNFKCVYCYEVGQVGHKTMDEETMEATLKWYKVKLEHGHFKTCSVDLYGGEPLLFMPLIIKFLSRLKEITGALGIKLKIRLITNGYLLTLEVIKKLLIFGLNEIHITLDGPPATHNQRRPLKNGGETFSTILRNMVNAVKSDIPVEITCRISFDASNSQNIPALLDLISEQDPAHKIYPYFGTITQTTGQIISPESFCSRHILDDQKIAETFVYFYGESKKRGFEIPDLFTLGPCMVVADGGGVIAPDGLIYKCLDMIGCPKLVVDDVNSQIKPVYYDFMRASQLDFCLYKTDCPFVPVCGGGCCMESFLATGDYQKTICHRDMLEKIYAGLLPLQF
jgi:uncharacterized protein